MEVKEKSKKRELIKTIAIIFLAVLLLLNTYPLLVSQNLVFRTKQTAMVGSVKICLLYTSPSPRD